MARHVATSAYAHCLALVAAPETAAELAAVAVRRGGRSLGTVLGHARSLALTEATARPPVAPELAPDATPADVAWALAATRPPVERAVVDLAGRYGLGRSGLGIALRMSPASAAARVDAVGRAWDAELDPALLAWLGPGDCDALAALLAERPRSTEDLRAVAGDVAAHASECAACADRQRAMASVRHLVNGTPLPAPPPTVVAAAAGARLHPPALPPPLEPRGRRHGMRMGVAAVVVVLIGAAAVVVDRLADGGDADPTTRVLSQAPLAASALELSPATVELAAGRVDLVNRSVAPVRWQATTDAEWLTVAPDRGRLEPGASQVLRLQGAAPEGELRAAVLVSGDDGSAAAAALVGTVEHPPELDALADGCRVEAVVEDEGDVRLTLHWRDGGAAEHTSPMPMQGVDAGATLPPTAVTWWVTAVDGRGNQARTADTPAGCPP